MYIAPNNIFFVSLASIASETARRETRLILFAPSLMQFLWLGFLFQNTASISRPRKIFCKKLTKLCSYSLTSMLEEHTFSAVHAMRIQYVCNCLPARNTYRSVTMKTQRIVLTRSTPLAFLNYIVKQKRSS
jgi:hypothetical protein